MSPEEILEFFYDVETFTREPEGWSTALDAEKLRGVKLTADLRDARDGAVLAKEGTKVTVRALRKIEEVGATRYLLDDEELLGRFVAYDIVEMDTGAIYAEAGEEITTEVLETLHGAGITVLETLAIDSINVGPYVRNTLMLDKNNEPRRRAERYLPRHASGRAADAWNRPTPCSSRCSSIASVMTCRLLAG